MPLYLAEMIREMHPHLRKKLKKSLQEIANVPHSGKALKEELEGLRSYRVSRFRIIYRVSDKREIEVVAIGPRRHIYEETLRLIIRDQKKKTQ